MPEPLRLMHVHAHPDDESSKGAASTAQVRRRGRRRPRRHLHRRRARLDPQPEDGPPRRAARTSPRSGARRWSGPARSSASARTGWASSTPAARGRPAAAAARGLLRAGAVEEAAEPLVRLIREFRPHVMTTYDENGGYPHPDHVMCHEVSVAAFEAAGDPERYPDAGEPWQPLKLYYHHALPPRRAPRRCTTRCSPHGLESPYAERLELEARARRRAHGSPPGCRARTTSRSATRPCSRTPPRSTPTAPGSRSRWSSRRRSGRPRTTSWRRSMVDVRDARGRPVRRHPRQCSR